MNLDHERLDVYHLALDFWFSPVRSSKGCLAVEATSRISFPGRRYRSCWTSPRERASTRSQTSDGTIWRRAARRRGQRLCWTFAVGSMERLSAATTRRLPRTSDCRFLGDLGPVFLPGPQRSSPTSDRL